MSFINKVVLVTGAASGLGEAIALSFAKESARLALIDVTADKLKISADNCEKVSKLKVFCVATDLTKDEQVKDAVQRIVKEFGRIDVVVNSAGIFRDTQVLGTNIMSSYDQIAACNLRAVVSLTSEVTPVLIESKGCIVNISSVCAKLNLPGTLIYSMCKSALIHFTKGAALELAPHGVRINSVSPGSVETNLYVNMGVTAEKSKKFWKYCEGLAPLQRLVDAKDVAAMVCFLSSDKAVGITGVDYVIDCGIALHVNDKKK